MSLTGAEHHEAQAMLRSSKVGGIQDSEVDVIPDGQVVAEDLLNGRTCHFVSFKRGGAIFARVVAGLVRAQVPVFPRALRDRAMTKCCGNDVGHVLEYKVPRTHLTNETHVFVDEVSSGV